jgi:hypothetical protein
MSGFLSLIIVQAFKLVINKKRNGVPSNTVLIIPKQNFNTKPELKYLEGENCSNQEIECR